MGYRFTLESANHVANLSFGRVFSCYDEIYSSAENYYGFVEFLEGFPENFHSQDRGLYHEIGNILSLFREEDFSRYLHREPHSPHYNKKRDRKKLEQLKRLSDILSRCRIKSLLLPPFKGDSHGRNFDFITSRSTLSRLVKIHPGDSCLILQPEEQIYKDKITIFDAFPNFDIALRQADLWPAVMFWDDTGDIAFVPVQDEFELMDLFEIIHFERKPIPRLRECGDKHRKNVHFYFHLSDLHMGAKNTCVSTRRLEALIQKQLSTLEMGDNAGFIITGDMVDSPTVTNNSVFRSFENFMTSQSTDKPIVVIGNHDVNIGGLSFFKQFQSLAYIVGDYPKIEILEEPKIIFLLFNSNVSGKLAQGEIGAEQMSEMGNKLDAIEKLQEYKLIALLHHHVTQIEKPHCYGEKWYERLIPDFLWNETLKLADSDAFLEWLEQRNVRLVLHGHKHIPAILKHKDLNIISCGSSTGHVTHIDPKKTYLSYNLLKFTKDTVTCTQFAEELSGAGAKNIRTSLMSY